MVTRFFKYFTHNLPLIAKVLYRLLFSSNPISLRVYAYPGYPGRLSANYQPDLRPESKGKYRNMEDYTVSVQSTLGHVYEITVPVRLITDGASVPRVAWSISGLRPDGLLRAAALVHDWLCKLKGKVPCDSVESGAQFALNITPDEAHMIFYDLMKAAGMNWRAEVAYTFVFLFGPRWN